MSDTSSRMASLESQVREKLLRLRLDDATRWHDLVCIRACAVHSCYSGSRSTKTVFGLLDERGQRVFIELGDYRNAEVRRAGERHIFRVAHEANVDNVLDDVARKLGELIDNKPPAWLFKRR